MNNAAWVCISTNKTGTEVQAYVTQQKPEKAWIGDRWLVASVYTGCLDIANAIVQQIKNLGPNPELQTAVSVMQS